MADELRVLEKLEKELRAKLELNPDYIKWVKIKEVLRLFQETDIIGLLPDSPASTSAFVIPDEYNDKSTWRQKIAWAVKEINGGYIKEIVAQLIKAGESGDEETIEKRVSTIASLMKKEGLLNYEKTGKTVKYMTK